LLERPAEQLLNGLQFTVDGGRLQPLGAQEPLAIIDEIDGGEASEVARLGAGLRFQPTAKSAEIVQVAAGGDGRQVLLAERALERSEQGIPQNRTFGIIERNINPLLKGAVCCVQYTTEDGPDCVQERLYALIDRNNRLPAACFPRFPVPGEWARLRQKLARYVNRLKPSNLLAS
jgi:hypothetical protein